MRRPLFILIAVSMFVASSALADDPAPTAEPIEPSVEAEPKPTTADKPTEKAAPGSAAPKKADTADPKTKSSSPARVPGIHRETAGTCDSERSEGLNDPEGSQTRPCKDCNTDADCTEGANGRCESVRCGNVCSYDQCFSDADCSDGAVCHCGAGEFEANVCLINGNCQLDSDCGDYTCSPSLGSCGYAAGYKGYYCHTAEDECVDDTDCMGGGQGYCQYESSDKKWVCSYGQCVG